MKDWKYLFTLILTLHISCGGPSPPQSCSVQLTYQNRILTTYESRSFTGDWGKCQELIVENSGSARVDLRIIPFPETIHLSRLRLGHMALAPTESQLITLPLESPFRTFLVELKGLPDLPGDSWPFEIQLTMTAIP